jgi:acetylornithine deacetylase/succinyl-diaminopimelate desuccinylase-like protein
MIFAWHVPPAFRDECMTTPARNVNPTSALDPRLAEKILAAVREEEIVAMATDAINIPSPTGEELQMAEYMRNALQQLGLTVTWQEVEEGRANVVGRWTGSGGGKNLMFNGHMDTSNTGREEFLTGIGYKPNAVIKDGVIYGLGIYNMKGALVCYTHAVKALQGAGVKLKGDVIIAAVAGEIEKTQWGKYKGKEYRGYGYGTHYLVNHGVLPDMCILGEPTDMHVVLEHFGSMWVRISCSGIYVHSAFCEGREEMNSIRRMHELMEGVMEWASTWEKKAAYGGKKAIVNLGGIRGGHPWRASRTPEKTDLFLDVRVPPTIPMNEARRDIHAVFVDLEKKHPDWGLEFETYVSVPGARISEDHPMIRAIDANHERVMGQRPEREVVTWCSDASVLSRYGIETVNYGPSSGPRDAEGEKVRIKTLVDITQVYALTAAELCGVQ